MLSSDIANDAPRTIARWRTSPLFFLTLECWADSIRSRLSTPSFPKPTNQYVLRTCNMQYAICRCVLQIYKNMTYSPISISIASGVSTVSTAEVFRLARILIILSIFCNKSSSRYGLIITSSIPAAFASSICPWRAFPAGGLAWS